MRDTFPLLVKTDFPAIRRRMALTWGVQSTLVEHVAHTDLMFIQVDEFFLGQGLAHFVQQLAEVTAFLVQAPAQGA